MKVFSFPTERTRLRPSFDDEIVRFFKSFTVQDGIEIHRELFNANAAHESRDEPSLRHEIEHCNFFSKTHWIFPQSDDISQQQNLARFGSLDKRRSADVRSKVQAGRRIMVLIDHQAIKSDRLSIGILIKVSFIQLRAFLRIKVFVWVSQTNRRVLI